MKLRKGMGLLLAVMLMMGCCAAGAEGEISLIYDAGTRLLTGTDNVTIQGAADFYLDGTHFKNARGAYIQNGPESFQMITLRGQDNEGKDRETGYAVLNLEGTVYVSEIYHGKDHRKTLYTVSDPYILRTDRKTESLMWLGSLAAAELDRSLMDMVEDEEREEGRAYSWIAEEGDIPEWLQYAVSMLWIEGVNRFYWPGYEKMTPYPYAEIEDYGTPTEGIILTTEGITLQDMEIHVTLDPEERLSDAGGTVSMRLTGANGSTHELMMVFSVSMDQYGESNIRENLIVKERMGDVLDGLWQDMTPGEGDIINMEGGGFEPLPEGELPLAAPPELPYFEGTVTPRTLHTDEDYIAYAREIWSMDYVAAETEGFAWSVTDGEENRKTVAGVLPGPEEGNRLELETDENGWIYRLQNLSTGEQDAEVFYSDTWSDEDWSNFSTEPLFLCLRFMEGINPGNEEAARIRSEIDPERGLYNPGFGGFAVCGDNYFLLYYTDPVMGEGERMSRTKFVYQIYPVQRFVEYNELIDPMEGGNG